MMRHIFLTGEKRIGKSTILQKALRTYEKSVGGFYTVRTNELLGNHYSVHLLRAGEAPNITEENFLFLCGEKDEMVEKRFDRIGCQALKDAKSCSLIVMDELGPHEEKAEKFVAAVNELLNGEVPILGVLQKTAGCCWPQIAAHPAVNILEITIDNRNDPQILKEIRTIMGKH